MKFFALIFSCLVVFSCMVFPGSSAGQQTLPEKHPIFFEPPLSPRIASYDIQVRLDPENRLLHATEVLHWVNKSPDTIAEMQFHLYLNAFRNNRSTFMKESGGISRGFKIGEKGWGFIEIDSMFLPTGENLTDQMAYIQPDDGNEWDKTVVSVPLPRPLLPGQSIDIHIHFTAKLPTPPFARTGAKKEFFFVGQWFPKVGVYEEGGWNTHQFHANSEFFADYGVYNVWITTPSSYIVGATGLEVETNDNPDGTRTHYYHAEDVHDFAWTASTDYVEFTGNEGDVDIRVLMQPDHSGQGERFLNAARTAIRYFQSWYGEYPFPNLTVVDPRRGAMGAGGMEYPTLITAFTSYGIPKGIRAPEMVIIHEFGHNYWYHLLASNEFEEAWMDEGINTYSEIQIMDARYGPEGNTIDLLGMKISDLQFQRFQYLTSPDLDPIVKKAWQFYSGGSYSVNSYSKPGLVLSTLQNYLGRKTMQKIMQTYFERWKFKHPKTRDFIAVANEISGKNLNDFFDQALFTNKIFDYSVDRVFTRKVRKPKGYDFDLSAEEEEKPPEHNQDSLQTSLPDSTIQPNTAAKDTSVQKEEQKLYESGVNLRRLGTFTFPVELQVVFDNGDTLLETWDGRDLWKKYRYVRPARLLFAQIDPERKILLDVNYTNNSKAVKRPRIGVNKLAIRFLFWVQFILDDPQFMNLLTPLKISF